MEDQWRERLKEMIAADKRSLRAISREAGFGENYIQQMLKDEKDPSFPRLAKVLSVLGVDAAVYVTTGIHQTPGEQLHSALLAFGVHPDDIGRAVSAVKVFLDEADDEQLQPDPRHDQPEPANPRHESEPSRRRPQRSGA